MNYLLDTNIFIFLISGNVGILTGKQQEILFNPQNDLYLSEASYFEIAIKVRLAKPNFSHIDINKLESKRKRFNISILKSKPEYYLNIPKVPKVNIDKSKLHGDTFDLLIISQAIFENITVLSTDSLFPLYANLKTII